MFSLAFLSLTPISIFFTGTFISLITFIKDILNDLNHLNGLMEMKESREIERVQKFAGIIHDFSSVKEFLRAFNGIYELTIGITFIYSLLGITSMLLCLHTIVVECWNEFICVLYNTHLTFPWIFSLVLGDWRLEYANVAENIVQCSYIVYNLTGCLWIRWMDDWAVRNIRWWAKPMQMVFILDKNAIHVFDFIGECSAAIDHTQLRKYTVHSCIIQEGRLLLRFTLFTHARMNLI